LILLLLSTTTLDFSSFHVVFVVVLAFDKDVSTPSSYFVVQVTQLANQLIVCDSKHTVVDDVAIVSP